MFDASSQFPDQSKSRGIIAITDRRDAPFEQDNAPEFDITSPAPNGPWNPHAVAASVYIGQVYDYYLQRFSRNSIDGQGGTIRGVINLPDNNAYSPPPTQAALQGDKERADAMHTGL